MYDLIINIIILISNMEQDYFGYESTNANVQSGVYGEPQDEEFYGFEDPSSNQPANFIQANQNEFSNVNPSLNFDSNANDGYQPKSHEQQLQQFNKMRQQEEEITERLMNKSNLEQKLKLERKEKGNQELSNFLSQRQSQIAQRKQSNKQKQKAFYETSSNVSIRSSWEKIAQNIATKQGEYPGKKDVTRMKQAIINKKFDDKR